MGGVNYGIGMRWDNKKGGMYQSNLGKMGKKGGVEKTKSRQTETEYNNIFKLKF